MLVFDEIVVIAEAKIVAYPKLDGSTSLLRPCSTARIIPCEGATLVATSSALQAGL